MILNHPPKVKIEKNPPPLPISNNHKHQIFAQIVYVNGHDLLHKKSGKVKSLYVQYFISRSASTIITDLDIVKQTYEARFFDIDKKNGKNEFNIHNLKTSFLPTKLHISRALQQ